MRLDTLMKLRTDPKLLSAVTQAAKTRLSAQDVAEQKVSFVYASFAEDSGVTKDGVRAMILQQGGITLPTRG